MIGTIGFLFWSAVVLGPALFAVSIVGRLLKRGRLNWLGSAAVASGFLAGGVIGWASVPPEWTDSIWTTIDAAGNSVKYGEAFEHTAERALMYFFFSALVGELAFGLAALLVVWGSLSPFVIRRGSHEAHAVPMKARILVVSLLVWSFHLIKPGDALACVCLGEMPTIESRMARAPLVIAARVTAAEPLKDSVGQPTSHIAAIGLEVLDVLRGEKGIKQIRIWDQLVSSTCSVELVELPVGTLLIVAIDPKQERSPELWELLGIHPQPSDYVFGTCQQYWKTFKTEPELRRYVMNRPKR